jgi:hypothetical protein
MQNMAGEEIGAFLEYELLHSDIGTAIRDRLLPLDGDSGQKFMCSLANIYNASPELRCPSLISCLASNFTKRQVRKEFGFNISYKQFSRAVATCSKKVRTDLVKAPFSEKQARVYGAILEFMYQNSSPSSTLGVRGI